MYADDSKISTIIDSQHSCNLLQNNLDKLYQWSLSWGLQFNVKKCKVLSICRNKNVILFDHKLNNIVLERVYEFCDLVLIVISNFS